VHCIDTATSSLKECKKKSASPPAYIKKFATKYIANNILRSILLTTTTVLLFACSSKPLPPQSPTPTPAPSPGSSSTPAPVAAAPSRAPLAGNWTEYRRRAAQVILAANPGASFTGPTPPQWNGIATVTVALNADGSIRNLDLMRGSRVAPQVNNLALVAARRAANFGPVSHLPQPWQFNETFLYNDDNKFQLITVLEGR
jgi:outer membrane biosynthesis protein TonB